MTSIGPAFVTVIAGIIGLAIVAVIVSRQAQTPNVLQAGGSALAQIIGAAVSPVAGTGANSYGSAGAIGGGSVIG
jgi:hypothetical protein